MATSFHLLTRNYNQIARGHVFADWNVILLSATLLHHAHYHDSLDATHGNGFVKLLRYM